MWQFGTHIYASPQTSESKTSITHTALPQEFSLFAYRPAGTEIALSLSRADSAATFPRYYFKTRFIPAGKVTRENEGRKGKCSTIEIGQKRAGG